MVGPTNLSGYAGLGVTVNLSLTTAQNLGAFGKDILSGIENVYGTNGNDVITGTAGANYLNGGTGNDRLVGKGGNDNLLGRDGADTFVGGGGADLIECGISNNFPDSFRDRVVYTSTTQSGLTAATRDTIRQFVEGKGAAFDRIDLSAIDGNADLDGKQGLTFVAGIAGPGQVSFVADPQGVLVVVNTNADLAPDVTILVQGVTALHGYDFIL